MRLVSVFLLCLSLISPAVAQNGYVGGIGAGDMGGNLSGGIGFGLVAGAVGSAPSPSYQGPGDIAPGALGFWSCGRAYNDAYATAQSPLCTVVDTTTGLASCTFNVGTNGYANLTALVCVGNTLSVTTFCTVTHLGCSVSEMFDQSGNGLNATQASLVDMPAFTLNAQNSLPCPAGTNTTGTVLTTSPLIRGAPYSMEAVAERTGAVTTPQTIVGSATTGNLNPAAVLTFTNVSGQVSIDNGATINLTGVTESAPHALIAVSSASDPLFAADSGSNTSASDNGTNTIHFSVHLMNNSSVTVPFRDGYLCEAAIWPSDLNTDYTSILANMRSNSVGWNF